jgi:hypothetical protein
MDKILRREFFSISTAAGSILLSGRFAAQPLTAAEDIQ